MLYLIEILSLLWFIRTAKFVLFWVYLWQLKEYHIGRFKDHFTTHKGRKIFLNYLWLSKFALLLLLFLDFQTGFYLLLLVYLAESLIFILNLARKSAVFPKFTAKTVLLSTLAVADVVGYLWFSYTYVQPGLWFVVALLLYDIFVPLIVSLIVLIIEPFFMKARTNILK